MKNNDIINKLNDDNIIDDIQADIDSELGKSEPDYDKIACLTELIAEMTGNSLSDDKITENISKITEEYDSQKKRNRVKIIYRWISALSACLVLVLALNAYTMVSFGDNLFRAVVEMTQSGFSIDFSEKPDKPEISASTAPAVQATTAVTQTVPPLMTMPPLTTAPAVQITNPATNTATFEYTTAAAYFTEIPPAETVIPETTFTTAITTPALPAGQGNKPIGNIISEKCQEAGITPCSLNYYTDIELKDFSYEDNELSIDCYFTFTDNERQLDIIIEQYKNTEDIPTVLIPSNQDGYYPISCSIGDFVMFYEDTHITAVFVYDNTVYTITGYNFSFEDMQDIIQAYSPEKKN